MNRRNALKTLASTAALLPLFRPAIAASTSATPPPAPAGPNATPGMVTPYRYPHSSPASLGIRIEAGGQDIFVYRTAAGDFGAFATEGATEVIITFQTPIKSARVSPKRHGLKQVIDGARLTFTIPGPLHLVIEAEGQTQLFLFVDAPETNRPEPGAPGVHFFAAGQVYEVGELRVQDNARVYIEAGAVVRGCIRATSGKNVRIDGHGVLDGGYFRTGNQHRRSILLEDCEDSVVEGIIMIEPTGWMLVLGACRRTTVRNVKLLGEVASSDGVDIVGSQQIRVENCFFRNGDDCVVLKSLDLQPHDATARLDYTRNVEDIEVVGCAFMSNRGGQAMEIGHELRCDHVRRVRFHDCDVLAVRQYGAPFGIHNADHAMVQGITWENIRVEHYYDKLVDFRIVHTRWSRDQVRGQVRNVTLRNIQVTVSEYNPGYTISVIGGFSPEHTIEDVKFEQFHLAPTLYESKFSSFENKARFAAGPDDIDLYLRYASNVTFT